MTTTLQFTVSNQLFDDDQIEKGYTYQVAVMSLASIMGPIIGGKRSLGVCKEKLL